MTIPLKGIELKRSFSLGLVNNGERPIPVYVKLGLWNDLTGYLLNHDKNAVTVDEKAMLNHYRSELVSTLKSYKLNVTVDKQIECIQSVIDRKNALGTILATPTSNLGFLASWTLGATCTNSIQILIDHQKELESRQSTCESTPQI